jgi:hypothetical protein
MKRTIYDCWNCRHSHSNNPYGIDYCEAHDTRCSFAHDDCDDFEPDTNPDGDNRQPEPPRRLTVIGWYLLGIITALLLCWLLTGCATTKYVPVETVRTDTLMVAHIVTDSVWVWNHDSIVINQQSDTVRIERWHWRDRWRDRVTRDTVYNSRVDSVTVTREVEKPLTKSQRARLHLANIVLIVLGMVAVFFVAKFVNKIRKLR